MPAFGGTTAAWDSTDVIWAFHGGPAPAAPAALTGTRAPIMLDYLPDYYESSTYVRAIQQALGYDADYLWHVAEEFANLTNPDDCPSWALPAWEAQLRLPGTAGWSEADRRAWILANIPSAYDAGPEENLYDYLAKAAQESTVTWTDGDDFHIGSWDDEHHLDVFTSEFFLSGAGLWFPDKADYMATSPSTAALESATVDIAVDVQFQLPLGSLTSGILVFTGGTAFFVSVLSTGTVSVSWFDGGSTYRDVITTNKVPQGVPVWLYAGLDGDDGSGGHQVTVRLSLDEWTTTTWTETGDAGAFTTDILVTASQVEIGHNGLVAGPFKGHIDFVAIYDSPFSSPNTLFLADFGDLPKSIAPAGQTLVDSANDGIVTIEGTNMTSATPAQIARIKTAADRVVALHKGVSVNGEVVR